MRLDERRCAPLLADGAAHAAGDDNVDEDAGRQVRPPDLEPAARGPRSVRGGDPAARSPARRRRPEHAAARIREPAARPAHRGLRDRPAARALAGAVRQAGPDRVPRADDRRAPLRGPGRHGRHRRRRGHDQLLPRHPGRLLLASTSRPGSGCSCRPIRPPGRLDDLRGKRVCATQGSTSIAALEQVPRRHPPSPSPSARTASSPSSSGEVDAITSDDAILLGFKAQDPYTKVIGGAIEPEPYGMAISKRHPDLVRWVNRELARMRADGTWRRLYREVASGNAARATGPLPRLMAELEDIDRALADLHTGADRLGGLLLELELDGDRKLLDATTLKGATATRWSAVDLLGAWESHAQLTATLERARRAARIASAAARGAPCRARGAARRAVAAAARRRCRPRTRRARSWPRPARRGERSRRGSPPSMRGGLHGLQRGVRATRRRPRRRSAVGRPGAGRRARAGHRGARRPARGRSHEACRGAGAPGQPRGRSARRRGRARARARQDREPLGPLPPPRAVGACGRAARDRVARGACALDRGA